MDIKELFELKYMVLCTQVYRLTNGRNIKEEPTKRRRERKKNSKTQEHRKTRKRQENMKKKRQKKECAKNFYKILYFKSN